jgi:hypothetical protein
LVLFFFHPSKKEVQRTEYNLAFLYSAVIKSSYNIPVYREHLDNHFISSRFDTILTTVFLVEMLLVIPHPIEDRNKDDDTAGGNVNG